MVREPIVDKATDGADGVEIQVDPTSYAERLDGEAAVVETVLATADGRVGVILETTPGRQRGVTLQSSAAGLLRRARHRPRLVLRSLLEMAALTTSIARAE
jgi:hypothetical protein